MDSIPNALTGKGLAPELIKEIMSSGRARGTYGVKILEFVNSDEAAVNPRETWPLDFSAKSATALVQSFRSAAKKAGLEDTLSIKQVGEDCYILHNERVAVLFAENGDSPEASEDNDNDETETDDPAED